MTQTIGGGNRDKNLAGDELLPLRAVAREIGISANTLYIWTIRGRVQAQKIAGRLVIRRSDIAAIEALSKQVGLRIESAGGRRPRPKAQ